MHVIGIPNAWSSLAQGDVPNIAATDGEILISLNREGHGPVRDYEVRLRKRLNAKFPDMVFFFEPANITNQILNFGLPAPEKGRSCCTRAVAGSYDWRFTGTAFLEPVRGTTLMNPNKALWEKGDFTRIAASMRESGEALVASLGVTAGLKVLDLGCGDGTTALPAARLGADVLGVDIASNLVEAGNRRARAEGLTNCRFQEGDASNLSELADQSFDLVVSIFGAMFAPRPFDVAKEMVRVTRPGGRIVMGNWIPGDPTLVAQILKISSAYSPPPPEGFVSPMTWGIESNVLERFVAAGVPAEKISFSRETYIFRSPDSPSAFVADFRNYYGPTMNAFAAAEQNGKAPELQGELEALFERQNKSDVKGATSIPATFLRVTVAR